MRFAALATIALFSSAALAADPAPVTPVTPGEAGHWSIVTGETVSPDRDALSLQVGWPGLTVGYTRGLSDRSDAGVRVGLLYSLENTDTSVFGTALDVPLRLVINRHEKVAISLHIDPGLRLYTKNGFTEFMTRFPVGA